MSHAIADLGRNLRAGLRLALYVFVRPRLCEPRKLASEAVLFGFVYQRSEGYAVVSKRLPRISRSLRFVVVGALAPFIPYCTRFMGHSR